MDEVAVRPPIEPDAGGRVAARAVAGFIGWGCVLGVLASLAAVADGGQRNTVVVLWAALAAWAGPLAVAALLIFAVARLWRGALVALAVLVVILAWLRPFPHGNADPSGPTARLVVMSQNVLFGGADPQQLVARVRTARPDVLVLTELTPAGAAGFDAAGLATLLPYRYLAPEREASGTGIYSTTPLSRPRPLAGTVFRSLEAEVTVGEHRVVVAAVHPVPPLQPQWAADHAALAAALGPRVRAGEPIVVAGDFNATQYNRPLRRLLDAGFTDAAGTRLWAWQQPTWPAAGLGDGPIRHLVPELIRIDHVLIPRAAAVERVHTVQVAGSDHAGLVASIRLGLSG